MKIRAALTTASCLISLSIAAPAMAATYLSDSFESPVAEGYSYGGTDSAGVVFGNGTGIQHNGSAFGYANAPDGVQTAHIQGTGSFTYYVDNLTSGNYYTLSFLYAARPNYGVDGLNVSYMDVFDPDLFTSDPNATPTSFTQVNIKFQYVGSGFAAITFAGTMDQGQNAGSDRSQDYNIAVDKISLADAVPEPATWAMMVLGFGMVGFGLRSRRKQSVRVTYA